MPIGESQKTSLGAEVLRVRPSGDSDCVVEALTHEQGRVALFVRGGRASRRRFRGALDVFVQLTAHCTLRRGLWILDAADVRDARVNIRTALASIERASHLCEAVRSLSAEHHANPELFAAYAAALDQLDAGDRVGAALHYPAILQAVGIGPDMDRCAVCAAPAPDRLALAASRHGGVCPTCGPDLPHLPAGLWRGVGPGGLATEAEAAQLEASCLDWIEAHIGRAIRSRAIDLDRLHA